MTQVNHAGDEHFVCYCPLGFHGPLCQLEDQSDEVTVARVHSVVSRCICLNGGTCVERKGSVTSLVCKCSYGYTGVDCSMVIYPKNTKDEGNSDLPYGLLFPVTQNKHLSTSARFTEVETTSSGKSQLPSNGESSSSVIVAAVVASIVVSAVAIATALGTHCLYRRRNVVVDDVEPATSHVDNGAKPNNLTAILKHDDVSKSKSLILEVTTNSANHLPDDVRVQNTLFI